MIILNLTQHQGTPEQGVHELPKEQRAELRALLTFNDLPTPEEIGRRAWEIAALAERWFAENHPDRHGRDQRAAMIGGAPYLMAHLERQLGAKCILPLYSFTRRESVEETTEDGTVVKRSIFRHLGWVKAPEPE